MTTKIINKLPTSAYDNKIYTKFSRKTIDKKAVNKTEFQNEFSLQKSSRDLLLVITSKLTEKNGFTDLEKFLAGAASLENVQIAVRGVGTEKFQKIILDFAEKNLERITILEDTEDNLRKMYAAGDVSLFLTKNIESDIEIQNSLSYACLPIAPRDFQGLIENYNPNLESGNGFLFEEKNTWSLFAALVRASEHYRFPYDWKTICQNALGN